MKLQAKDLMIGDWVMVYPWDETPWKPKKITDINFHSWEGVDFCDSVGVEGWDELSLDQIKPIPLTPEILEKNRFEKAQQVSDIEPFDTDEEGNKHYSYNKTFWGWFQPDNIFCIPANGMGWLHIKYVHQLQHALKLCGIEKEIEL